MKRLQKNILAITLLLALGMSFLSGCSLGGKTVTGTLEDAPYSCTWEVRRDICTISFAGELPENAWWTAYTSSAVVCVEQQTESCQFKVQAVEKGTCTLTLSLRESGLPVEQGVDFNFRFSVDEKKNLTVDTAEYSSLEADVLQSDTGTAAYWKESAAGGLFLYFTGAEWTIVTSRGVAVYGPTVSDDSVRLEVMAGEDSDERSLTLQSAAGDGMSFVFTSENGQLAVKECAPQTPEEMEALLQTIAAEKAASEVVVYGDPLANNAADDGESQETDKK